MAGTAARHGIRLIAPERPGYGLSGPQPGRSIPDWASDVAAPADALGLKRFGIAAYSVGSVYAMACACRLSDRVTRMALAGALAPLDAPGVTEGMAPSVSGLYALARSGPDALRNTLAPLAESAATLLAAVSASLPEWDKSVAGKRAAEFEAEYAQMLQGGIEGAVSDFVLASGECGFPLEGIHTEMHLWCGTDDRNTPPAMTAHLSSVLQNSRATVLPGEGHLSLYAHWEEILEWVM